MNWNGRKSARSETEKEKIMLLLVVLVGLLLALAPTWSYSRRWGYYPSGALGAVLLVVIALVLLGRVHL
jgi:Protein of unknown function (DUF3309)